MTQQDSDTAPREGNASLTFAHLTDPHLTSPDGAGAAELANKRFLGYLSWRRRRRFLHRPEVLAALVADLRRSPAQQIAITGDLTQVGLPAECRAARDWLEALSPPERVCLVPGNHDRYVPADWSRTIGMWSDYVEGESEARTAPAEAGSRDAFPTLTRRGPVAFIGVSSACASAPFMATGRLGRAQRARLADLLRRTGEQGLFRVVLIHHPPVPGSYKWRKRLTDDAATAALIERLGAELVLHGHTHRTAVHQLNGADGRTIPVIGLPSASEPGTRPERAARYSLWTVRRSGVGFELAHASRVYDGAQGAFTDGDDWNPLASS